jgi:hypothetical protein
MDMLMEFNKAEHPIVHLHLNFVESTVSRRCLPWVR